LRKDLESEARGQWDERRVEKGTRVKLLEDVRAHQARVKAAFARALAEQRDAERRLLEEERHVIEAMEAELGG
jgi:hypothetical protein